MSATENKECRNLLAPETFTSTVTFGQHDFGYRNYGDGLALGSNEGIRNWIDNRQLSEMRRLCRDSFAEWWQVFNKANCQMQAGIVWSAVRYRGRDAFYKRMTGAGTSHEARTATTAPAAAVRRTNDIHKVIAATGNEAGNSESHSLARKIGLKVCRSGPVFLLPLGLHPEMPAVPASP